MTTRLVNEKTKLSFVLIEIGCLDVAQAVLELAMDTRLASDSRRYACLCLSSAEVKHVPHHARPKNSFLSW